MPAAEARLLEGKVLAQKIQEEIKGQIAEALRQGRKPPSLLSIQVAADPSADWYVGQQKKLAEKLGIVFEQIPAGQIKNQQELIAKIRSMQAAFNGIFIAMPLPKGFNADEVLLGLDPRKDVEGIHPASLGLIVMRKSRLIPPTAYAAYKLIEASGIKLRGERAVLVGQSLVVGRPLQLLLGEQGVTTVVCNTGTPPELLEKFVRESKLVIACTGKPGLIKGSWISEGAVVIDVGTTEINGKLVGDVEFEEAKNRAAFITPVPGGVGPLTVTMLMQNLINAWNWQNN